MHASLTIGGIEVALTMPAGPLELVVAERYAPFLGAVDTPVCSLTLESNRRDESHVEPKVTLIERFEMAKFRFVHPGMFGLVDITSHGIIDIGPSPSALDAGLCLLFGILAPHHDALLLRATSGLGDDGAHVFVGASESQVACVEDIRATMTDGLVMVRREQAGWLAASTPFRASRQEPGPTRENRLSRLWHMAAAESAEVDPRQLIADHTFLATADVECRQRAAWVAEAISTDVPMSVLRFDSPRLTWVDAADAPRTSVG